MNKSIIICSLKYSPGLAKEIAVFYDQLKLKTNNVKMILSKSYKNTFNPEASILFLTNGRGILGMFYDIVNGLFIVKNINKYLDNEQNEIVFYNPHPLNVLIQTVFRRKCKFSIILHEPPKDKNELREHEFQYSLYMTIVNFFQNLSIKMAQRIFLVSSNSYNKFQRLPISKNKIIFKTNLLYKEKIISNNKKKYFSLIGHMTKGKGIDDFIQLINYCIDRRIRNINFCLITSSQISNYLSKLNPGYESILEIINKKDISDGEIDEVFSKSIATLLLHKVSAQSGVLPLAFMYKIPVICRNIDAFNQYVTNDENGILLKPDFEIEELYDACIKVTNKEFNNYLSTNAYLVFNNTFSEHNFAKYYEELIKI